MSAGGHSAIGPRPANQDVHFVDLGLGLLVVADGMGGHKAGEVASRLAVERLAGFIRDSHNGGDLTWPYPFDASKSWAVNRLTVALRVANRQVYETGRSDPRYAGMGTTVVAALRDGDHLVVGHVGDSRAYRLRNGHLEQMTQDDTWLNVMTAAGAAATAASHPMRHVLTRGIGMRPEIAPSIAEVGLVGGEHWLLCSDGVHGYATTAALVDALHASTPEAAAAQAVQSALDAGTTDNATAVVFYIGT